MTTENLNLTRRKFMIVSSTAIATPFLMNVAGLVPDPKGAEKEITYTIDTTCIGCHYCFYKK